MSNEIPFELTVDDRRVSPCPTSGCWLWTGHINQSGYAMTTRRGRTVQMHRQFWMAVYGDIPTHLVIDHLCKVRSCVNPDHLRLVTPRENNLTYSESPPAKNARKTHCLKCGGNLTVHTVRSYSQRRCTPCTKATRKLAAQRRAASHKAPE